MLCKLSNTTEALLHTQYTQSQTYRHVLPVSQASQRCVSALASLIFWLSLPTPHKKAQQVTGHAVWLGRQV